MSEIDYGPIASEILDGMNTEAKKKRFADDDAKEAWIISESARELERVLPADIGSELIPISFDPKGEQGNIRRGLHAIYTAGLVLAREEGILEVPPKSLQILDLLEISYQKFD